MVSPYGGPDLILTCALLPESVTAPPLPPPQGEQVHSDDSLPLHFPLVQVCCCPPAATQDDTLGLWAKWQDKRATR